MTLCSCNLQVTRKGLEFFKRNRKSACGRLNKRKYFKVIKDKVKKKLKLKRKLGVKASAEKTLFADSEIENFAKEGRSIVLWL